MNGIVADLKRPDDDIIAAMKTLQTMLLNLLYQLWLVCMMITLATKTHATSQLVCILLRNLADATHRSI